MDMDKKELQNIRRIYETQVEHGFKEIVLNRLSFEFLLKEAEKVRELEEENLRLETEISMLR